MSAQRADEAICSVRGVTKRFPLRSSLLSSVGLGKRSYVYAVRDVDLDIAPGEIVSLVGESGCGKSTLGRLLVRLESQSAGLIEFQGRDLREWERTDPLGMRRRVQIVFQNPFEAFDRRLSVGQILADPLHVHGLDRDASRGRDQVLAVLEQVGLVPAGDFAARYPHELSGGQLQRVAIARALLLRPVMLIADEPVSMLDVSVRAEIMNLLLDLHRQVGSAIVFITHDISVARYLADRVVVMYLGRVMEQGPADEVLGHPRHPYTIALMQHTPSVDPGQQTERQPLRGEPIRPVDPKPGCPFSNRCPLAVDICYRETPELRPVAPGTLAACHLVGGAL
jgi:oligopeptide/dipeptide ABC transporter ATP-binding protein